MRPTNLVFQRQHPLSSGLLLAVLGLYPPVNLVDKGPQNIAAALTGADVRGPYFLNDNTDSRYIEFPYSLGITAYTDLFTLMCWIKPTVLPSGGARDSYLARNTGVGNFDTLLELDNGKFAATAAKSGVGGISAQSAGNASTGVWQHLCGTFNGSAVSLYVNGYFVTSTNYDGNVTSSSANTAGWRSLSILHNGGQHFGANGAVLDIRIYKRLLSPSEIWQCWADPWAIYRPSPFQKGLAFAPASRRIFIVS